MGSPAGAIVSEFSFVLPTGYIDAEGGVHKEGTMRLATGGDEIHSQRDARVQNNPAFLVIVLLARVVTRLGGLEVVNPKVIEGLFAADLAYLQDLYNRLNAPQPRRLGVSCPQCRHGFEVEAGAVGE
jgi:hypothetical protein